MIWQLQEAKSKFSQLVNIVGKDGPQIVTKHGEKVAVVISYEEYLAFQQKKPTLLDILLSVPEECKGIDLDIERDKTDFGRNIEL